MSDVHLILQMSLPVVDTIPSKGYKFVTGVKIKATGDSNLNDGPEHLPPPKYSVSPP